MLINREYWCDLELAIENLVDDNGKIKKDAIKTLKNISGIIEKINSERVKEVYVVTNNAIVDDDIVYDIAGVTTSYEKAVELFNETVRNVKIDAEFDTLEAIDLNTSQDYSNDDSWYYEENDDSFSLYLNGEYNSNNFEVSIKKYELDKILNINMTSEVDF